jgi:hypothetical protein
MAPPTAPLKMLITKPIPAEIATEYQKFLVSLGQGRPGARKRIETPLVEFVVYFCGTTKPWLFRLFAQALKKLC